MNHRLPVVVTLAVLAEVVLVSALTELGHFVMAGLASSFALVVVATRDGL